MCRIPCMSSCCTCPWRRRYWRRELGPRAQSKGSESPILAVSQVSLHSTFRRRPALQHPPAALLSAIAADWRPTPRRYCAWTLPTYWPRPWRPAAARRGSAGGTRRATRPRRRRRRPHRRPYRRAPRSRGRTPTDETDSRSPSYSIKRRRCAMVEVEEAIKFTFYALNGACLDRWFDLCN